MEVKQAWFTHWMGAIVAIGLLGFVAGCAGTPVAPSVQPAPPEALPTSTVPISEAAVTVVPTEPAISTPLPTLVVTRTVGAGPTLPPGSEALVTLREDEILVGDHWGAEAYPVLSLGTVTSVAVQGSRVAYVVDGGILVADLRDGPPTRVADAPPAFLLGPDLVWTADGQALLTIADREDTSAKETGRSVDIGVVTLPNGPWRPGLALADRLGVTILRADRATGEVLLVAWSGEPTFKEALRYDLASGRLLATLPIAGEGEIVPSPDGKAALTTLFDQARGTNSSLIYDLTTNTAPIRYRLEHPSQTYAASHVWSPDGKRVAYLLRKGRAFWDTQNEGLGIWVWDLEKKTTTKVAEATDPAAGPVAWTPDGRYLIIKQIDAAGAGTFFALSVPDGAARQLPIDPASRILGWIVKG